MECIVIRLLIVLVCSLLLISCFSGLSQLDFSMTQNAVEEFHHRLETKQDERIFADASPDFKNSMNREASQAFFAKVRARLGPRAFDLPHLKDKIGLFGRALADFIDAILQSDGEAPRKPAVHTLPGISPPDASPRTRSRAMACARRTVPTDKTSNGAP
jgi:hypothetical protein